MPPQSPQQPAMSLKPADILYVLFRHKWKIAIISILGIGCAAGIYFFYPVPYKSQASLFVKYVVDVRTPSPLGQEDAKFKTPDQRGETVLATELAILQSLDLAREAAANLSAATLKKLSPDSNNALAAAASVRRGLTTEVPRKGSVIDVSFQHKDNTIVAEVLEAVIQAYYKVHAQIHRPATDFDQTLATQNDQLGSLLRGTEEQLRNAKSRAGITSLDETKKLYSDQISKIEDQIRAAEAELADRTAVLEQLSKSLRGQESAVSNQSPSSGSASLPSRSSVDNSEVPDPSSPVLTPDSGLLTPVPSENAAEPSTLNSQLSTVSVSTNDLSTLNSQLSTVSAPAETQAEHRRLASWLEQALKREQELLMVFTRENSLVKTAGEQVEKHRKAKLALEQQYPDLIATRPSSPAIGSTAPAQAGPVFNLITEQARISGIRSRINRFTNQLADLRKDVATISEAELNISDLERKKAIQEADYKFIAASLQQYRINRELEPGRVSNISKVQTPSPAFRDTGKLQKIVLMLLFGSIAAAFALAFGIEFYLDPSIKRPSDVEAKLNIPLFISIPRFARNRKSGLIPGSRLLPPGATRPLIPERSSLPSRSSVENSEAPSSDSEPSSTLNPQPSTNAKDHPLHLFTEALRDRLITFFELKNLTHKPKLVALTSCAEGSGVSTVAAGLAAALSETGEGNVLLVDMNVQNGAAHHFQHGDLACGIDQALEGDKRGEARVQENLYVVNEGGRNDFLPSILPRRFKSLVPRMKASDFDYIIFDMPPVSQISLTPRLARFMDTVLMVVESEKTDREVVKRAADILSESKTPVGIVLNKTRNYVPKALAPQEL